MAKRSKLSSSRRSAKEGRLTVYLDARIAAAIGAAAQRRGVERSALVAVAILDWLKRNPDRGVELPELEQRADRMPTDAAKRARELERAGATHTATAAALNREGYRTARGKRWNLYSVGRLLRSRR